MAAAPRRLVAAPRAEAARALVAALVACLAAPLAPAAACPPAQDGKVEAPRLALERLAPPPAGDSARFPRPDLGADGRLRLVWVEGEGEAARVALAALGADLAGWSAPVTVASGPEIVASWTDFPAVSALADGTLIAAWPARLAPDAHGYGTRVAVSGDGGASWSEPVWLHDDRAPDVEHAFASLAPSGDGFLAVWLDGRARDATRLLARRVARDGALGPEIVLDERVCDCCPTDLVRAESGFVAAWRDRTVDEVRDVAWARLAPDGELVERLHAPADGWRLEGCPVNGPAVAGRDGELALAWFTAVEGARLGLLLHDRPPPALAPADGPRGEDRGPFEGRVDLVQLADGALLVTWLAGPAAPGEEGAWRVGRFVSGPGGFEVLRVADTSAARSAGCLRAAPLPRGDGALLAWTERADGAPRLAVAIVR